MKQRKQYMLNRVSYSNHSYGYDFLVLRVLLSSRINSAFINYAEGGAFARQTIKSSDHFAEH